jgi:hypothetical protein
VRAIALGRDSGRLMSLRQGLDATRQRAARWLPENSVRVVLYATGSLLVLAAVYVVPAREALASTLTAAGTALIAFGALLPYIEGPFAFGPFRGRKLAPPATTREVPTTAGKQDVELHTGVVTAITPAPNVPPTTPEEEGNA